MSEENTVIMNVSPDAYYVSAGISESACAIYNLTMDLKSDFVRSVTFGEHIARSLENLLTAKEEYTQDNWDGYGAKAINFNSYNNARDFALSLPSNIPTPDVYVDPCGDIIFEWYEGKRKTFDIKIGENYELIFAGLYGSSTVYGVEYIVHEIPENITGNIKQLTWG